MPPTDESPLPRIPGLSVLARRCPCDNKGRSRTKAVTRLGMTAPRLYGSRWRAGCLAPEAGI